MTEALEKAAEKHKAAKDQAFAAKLAKRPPPNPVERAEIETARKRTRARAPRIAMHVEDRGKAGSVVYPTLRTTKDTITGLPMRSELGRCNSLI
jgi:hypothetical protein